jgi:S-adenosylmethionine-diacylglycerol 3-amino-3-carboxypropyl transferase
MIETEASSLQPWVEEAASMPVAFAQVREDPLLDLQVLNRLGRYDNRVMMIASGGCTAAALAGGHRTAHLHLVDINPAQMALCRLKLHLLQTADPAERAFVLGHSRASADVRAKWLAEYFDAIGQSPDVLGRMSAVAELGGDYVGRYEFVFRRLKLEMAEFAGECEALLNEADAGKRSALVAPNAPLGRALDESLDRVMALPNLIRLFGTSATRNRRRPFSRHFAERTRHAIAQLSTHDNPYLWQFLLGRYPPNQMVPWLNMPAPAKLPQITEFIGSMDAAVEAAEGEFDFIHLSNILDWLDQDQASRTLELAANKLRYDGYVLIRQLNSTLDIPALGDRFHWILDENIEYMSADTDDSFFYTQLHLGRKR